MFNAHVCFRSFAIAMVTAVFVGHAVAGGPPWNAPSVPPWERMGGYHGYKEPQVTQQSIPHRAQPYAAPERYTVVITPLRERHNLEDTNTVHLMAHVPENARVWIEGDLTTQSGTIRNFVSPPLTPGKEYRYTVRVDWMEGGKVVSQTKKVLVQAGEMHCLAIVEAGSPTDVETRVGAGLARLSRDDHALALAQKFCAVQPEVRLGEMGAPVKLMIKGQPIFLCCEGCQEKALENADRTLAKLKELKAKNRPAPAK